METANVGLLLISLTTCPFSFVPGLGQHNVSVCVLTFTTCKRKAVEKGDRGQTQINLTKLDNVRSAHESAYFGLDLFIIYYFTIAFMTIPYFQTSLTNPAQILSYLYSQVDRGHSRTNIKYPGNQGLRGFDDVQVGKS